MKIDELLTKNLRPDMEPSDRLLEEIRENVSKKSSAKNKYNHIARLAISACFVLFVAGATTIYAYNNGYLKRPAREYTKHDILKKDYTRTFCVAMDNKDDVELVDKITASENCDAFKKLYLGSAEMVVPVENLNPEYLEYVKEEEPVVAEFIENNNLALIQVELITYEGADKFELYEEAPGLELSCNYKGDAEVDYKEGSQVSLKLDINYDNCNSWEDVPISVVNLDSFTTEPEWFIDIAGDSFKLVIPYDEMDNFMEQGENACVYYVCRAKEDKEVEFRDEVRKIVGRHGSVLEAAFFK